MKRYGLLLLCACHPQPPAVTGSELSVVATSATVHVSFGADSKVTASDWTFCEGSDLTCSFEVTGSRDLPTGGRYLNATIAFNAPVGCGVTKAEININNPSWYNTMDVSLVDGYSNDVKITITEPGDGATTVLGPPLGATGNEEVLGLFPVGCDICVARDNPPCGISKGTEGCKAGTQYDPTPPCQHQGVVKGGGDSTIVVELVD